MLIHNGSIEWNCSYLYIWRGKNNLKVRKRVPWINKELCKKIITGLGLMIIPSFAWRQKQHIAFLLHTAQSEYETLGWKCKTQMQSWHAKSHSGFVTLHSGWFVGLWEVIIITGVNVLKCLNQCFAQLRW